NPRPPAVVLLSAGLDSATTLAIAADRGFRIVALSFDYGQRHAREVACAADLARHYQVLRYQTMAIDLRAFGGSALTADIAVPKDALPQSNQAQIENRKSQIENHAIP